MNATKTRRTYRFRSRGEAEDAQSLSERRALAAEWFATALIQGRTIDTGNCTDGTIAMKIGYFTTTHSGFVYALQTNAGPPHCIRGIWQCDDEGFRNVVAALLRYDDSHEFGRELDKARSMCWKAMIA